MADEFDITTLALVSILAGVVATGMCFLYCVLFCNMHVVLSIVLPRAEKIGILEPPIEAQNVVAVVGPENIEEARPVRMQPPI